MTASRGCRFGPYAMRDLLLAGLILWASTSCEQQRPKTDDSVKRDTAGSSRVPGESLVRASLEAPQEVRTGETVTFLIRLRNESAERVDLYLRGRDIAFDIILTDGAGREIWSRLHQQAVQAILRIEQLDAGKAIELRHGWNQRDNSGEQVRPGDYSVQGVVLTESEPIRTPTQQLRIRP